MIRKNNPVETLNLSVSTGLLKANTQVDIYHRGIGDCHFLGFCCFLEIFSSVYKQYFLFLYWFTII